VFDEAEKSSPSEKMKDLLEKLDSATTEMDATIQEVVVDLKNRQNAIDELQRRNQTLQEEESDLKSKIDKLRDVPLEVADYFRQINENVLIRFERRTAKRDLLFFVLGIIVTVSVTMIPQIMKYGSNLWSASH
jgi:hypothetical protein